MLNNATITWTETHEYVTFRLGDSMFGTNIINVQELRRYEGVTRLANMIEGMKGVIHLRNNIIPIFDLRQLFKFDPIDYNELNVVIILNLNGVVVGVLVDGVSDVIELKTSEVKSVNNGFSNSTVHFITGIATIENQMIVLIDFETLIVKLAMNSQSIDLTEETQRLAL